MALSLGLTGNQGVLPRLEELAQAPYVFKLDFGLAALPEDPGVLLIRGARQYGKSTWLEEKVHETVKRYGPGSAYYLNGDEFTGARDLRKPYAACYRYSVPV